MSISNAEIVDYLTRYAASLTGFDADAAADLWSTPGMIADDRFSGVLESREAMLAGLKRSYPLYQQLGLCSVTADLLDQTHLTDRLVLVRVRWHFHDANGNELTDSTSYYLLRNEQAGLRACLCVETDSAEKLRALASARGIQLPPPTS